MAEAATKLPVKTEKTAAPPMRPSRWPFASLHHEIERVFDDFERNLWPFPRRGFELEPFWTRGIASGVVPSVDISEEDKAYKVTAELPGMSEKNVEVQASDGMLTIKGEKQESREEKKKGCYLSEREFGAFQRSFQMPKGVDVEKVEAALKDGVLTITLPKTAEAQKKEKTIPVQKT
jgi:HSP20 family protein